MARPTTNETVIIGSKLPVGIFLEHPLDPSKKIEVLGLNKSLIIGAPFNKTVVNREIWEAWKAANESSRLLKSKSIFDAGNEDEFDGKSKDFKAQKSGFEPCEQNGGGVTVAKDD
jgi:hypothetical protein